MNNGNNGLNQKPMVSRTMWRIIATAGVFCSAAFSVTPSAQAAAAESYAAESYEVGEMSRAPSITRRGIITRGPIRNYFEMRSNNGETFRVIGEPGQEPRGLRRGDRVEVVGRHSRDLLVSTSIRILSGGTGNTQTLRGVVTQDLAGNSFIMQTRQQTRVTVLTRNREPVGLRRGVQVEVSGRWENSSQTGRFIADTARLVTGGNPTTDYDDGNYVTLRGVVTEDLRGNQFRFQLRNGDELLVDLNRTEPVGLTRGARVRVSGRWDATGNVFRADDTRIMRSGDPDYDDEGYDWDNDDNNRISIDGTITQLASSRRNLTMRGDDGRTYILMYRGDGQLEVGDRVHVEGELNGTTIEVEDINRM